MASASINDEGIIIKNTKLGEADRIALILTRNSGKISAVVKGARRTTAKLGGKSVPLLRIALKFTHGKSLDILQEASIIDAFADPISKDYDKFLAAEQMCNIADKVVSMQYVPQEQQYLLLVRALKMLSEPLPSGISANIVAVSYVLRSLSIAGFEVDPDDLQGSGLDIDFQTLAQSTADFAGELVDALIEGNWENVAKLLAKDDNFEIALTKATAHYAMRHLESRLVTYDSVIQFDKVTKREYNINTS